MAKSSRFQALVADAKTRVAEVTAAEAEQRHAGGAILLDVREQDEFQAEHARGAVHLSRGILEVKIEEQFPDPTTPLVCYCGGGGRSALAADNLQRMGYTNVVSLAGGFKAWKVAGRPTEK